MRITSDVREKIITLAREQVAERGQPLLFLITSAVGCGITSASTVLRSVDSTLGRRCTYRWSDGTLCNNLLPPVCHGSLQRTRCGSHYVRRGKRVVQAANSNEAVVSDPVTTPPSSPAENDAAEPDAETRAAWDDPARVVPTSAVFLRDEEVEGWPLVVMRDETGAEIPLVADDVLAERLGFGSVTALRNLCDRNADELGSVLLSHRSDGKGRPKQTRYFDEEQTTLITMFARTDVAREQRRLFIAIIKRWRAGRLLVAPTPSVDVVALVEDLTRRLDALEKGRRLRLVHSAPPNQERLPLETPPAPPPVVPGVRVPLDPSLFQQGEIVKEARARGHEVNAKEISRIGLALGLVGDRAFGDANEGTRAEFAQGYTTVAWGMNVRGRDAIVAEVVRYLEDEADLGDYCKAVTRVGTGGWLKWTMTARRPTGQS